jgi:ferredoxin
MTYVIAEPCNGSKDTSCVGVCPVDCIHPTPDDPRYAEVEQRFIDPAECVDSDACVEACPGSRGSGPGEWQGFIQLNDAHFSGSES